MSQMYILVFISFFFEGEVGMEGYISMEKSPGFEIGKLGNYEDSVKLIEDFFLGGGALYTGSTLNPSFTR